MDNERNAGNGIRVTIDPESLRSCMALWKDSVDVKIPMKDDFKLHFIAKRREILSNFERTAGAWLMAFRGAEAEATDRAAFDAFVREITEFCDWAKAEIAKFDGLANEG